MNDSVADKEHPEAPFHVGRHIKHYMEANNYSAAWLASRLFCDRTNVYKIYSRRGVDSEMLFRISFFLRHDFFADYSHAFMRIKSRGGGMSV